MISERFSGRRFVSTPRPSWESDNTSLRPTAFLPDASSEPESLVEVAIIISIDDWSVGGSSGCPGADTNQIHLGPPRSMPAAGSSPFIGKLWY
jgi:hypothetical protein